MKRDEAILQMSQGECVKHKTNRQDEYYYMNKKGKVKDESGMEMKHFFEGTKAKIYNEGWSIVKNT